MMSIGFSIHGRYDIHVLLVASHLLQMFQEILGTGLLEADLVAQDIVSEESRQPLSPILDLTNLIYRPCVWTGNPA